MLVFCLFGSEAAARGVQQELPRFFRHFRSYNVYDSLTRAVLDGGLTVVVEEHPTSVLAAVVTSVRLGWIDTRSSDSRVLAERLLFVLDESIGRLGGVSEYRLDAHTTEFRSVVPAEEVEHAVKAHLGLLRIEETDFELERSRVAGWLEERRAWPENRLRDEMRSAVFGEVFSLKSPFEVSDPDLAELHRAYFHPGNVVLAVAGAVRREAVLRRVSDEVAELGPIAAGNRGVLGGAKEPESFSGLTYRQAETTFDHPVLLMGFRGPEPGHPEHRVLELVRYLLVEGYGSLLRLPRPEEVLPPFEVSGFLESTPRGGLLWFAVFPRRGLLERSEARLLAVLDALGRTDLPEPLLSRAKALMVVDSLRRLESLSARASGLALAEARGDLRNRDAFPAQVAAISAGEVRRVVRKYLHPASLSVVELSPSGTAPRAFTPESYRETLDILVPVESEAELALLTTFADEDFEAFRPPAFSPSFAAADLRRSSILRGPEIYLREHQALPLAHLGFFYPGGRISEQPDNAGITNILLRALLNHHARRDGGREILSLEAEGVRIEPVNEPDFLGFQVTALSSAVQQVSRQIVGWLRSTPEWAEEDLEAARTAIPLVSDPQRDALDERLHRAGAGVFGGHPYGFSRGASTADGPDVNLEDLDQWREALIRGVNPYILVSGDVRGTSFLQDSIDRLSDPQFVNRRAVTRRVEGTGQAPFVDSADTRTLLAFLGPGADSYYVEMLDVVAALLGGPSGLATRKLREEKLGFEARLLQRSLVQAGLVTLEVLSTAGRREEAAETALHEVRSFSESPAELSRFYAALVKTITRFMVRQSDPDFYLIDTMTAVLAGKPPDYARRYVLNVKQMRMGEVESAIRRFLGGLE